TITARPRPTSTHAFVLCEIPMMRAFESIVSAAADRDRASNRRLRVEMTSLHVTASLFKPMSAEEELGTSSAALFDWRKSQWDCRGSKVLSHQEQSAVSSCPKRYRIDCCTSSRCAGACA